ncbi:MAG TPA: 4Fe-4S binding protein [Desulfatiglandales bacterium]|nr:4Fe-4S binding protein [Desulfatiglandales bacterium]
MPPIIDHDKCIGCGICVDICDNAVLMLLHNQSVVDDELKDECTDCEGCVENCPAKAITLE